MSKLQRKCRQNCN